MPVDTSTRWPLRIAGDEIRQRLARAGARFGEQCAAVLDNLRDRLRHAPLAFPRLIAVEDAGERTCLGKCVADGGRERSRVQARRSGYSGNFRHSLSTSPLTVPSARSSSGAASTRAISSPI